MGNAGSVLPAILHATEKLITSIAPIFWGNPDQENATVRDIREHHEREERDREREREAREKMQAAQEAEERARAQRWEAEGRERLAQCAAEEAQVRARRADAAAQEARRRVEEQEHLAAEAHRAAEESKRRADEQEQLRSAAEQQLQDGIQPTIWPTPEELAAAKRKIGYQTDKLHFAVCGPAGSGKSSLINAFLGRNLAPTGIVECTTTIGRYPDTRTEPPYNRLVWYDIPGAGTLGQPAWQYFIDQGLFVFDFIIMAYDARFTEIDAKILEHCRRFKIPTFMVRSKTDMHVDNLEKAAKAERKDEDEEDEFEEDDPTLLRMSCKAKYERETRADFARNMQDIATRIEDPDLTKIRVFLVSSYVIQKFLAPPKKKKKKKANGTVSVADPLDMIDEKLLVKDLLKTAVKRRYSSRKEVTDVLGEDDTLEMSDGAQSDGYLTRTGKAPRSFVSATGESILV